MRRVHRRHPAAIPPDTGNSACGTRSPRHWTSVRNVRARGTLWYVNNSPDTLGELFFHQYLNAFRPGSKWSEVDEREGRVRFQHLEEPDFAYERFTAPVSVNGAAVPVEYPGAPDSTVVRLALPARLAPR